MPTALYLDLGCPFEFELRTFRRLDDLQLTHVVPGVPGRRDRAQRFTMAYL